jgi:anti-sigma regulatory factor (Ser/Thr protein kinase)
MCFETTERLPCELTSVRAARSLVADSLHAWGTTTADVAYRRVADAVLVASELIANAVKFCMGEIELKVSAHRDRIEIDVTDDSRRSARRQDPHLLSSGGRGLIIVDAVAERWGQRQHGDSKTVWAHIRIPPGSALAHGCTLLDV